MNSFDPFGFTLGDDVGSNVTNYPSGNKMAYGFKAEVMENTFNIDDVGYASASDVNMSVDALSKKLRIGAVMLQVVKMLVEHLMALVK